MDNYQHSGLRLLAAGAMLSTAIAGEAEARQQQRATVHQGQETGTTAKTLPAMLRQRYQCGPKLQQIYTQLYRAVDTIEMRDQIGSIDNPQAPRTQLTGLCQGECDSYNGIILYDKEKNSTYVVQFDRPGTSVVIWKGNNRPQDPNQFATLTSILDAFQYDDHTVNGKVEWQKLQVNFQAAIYQDRAGKDRQGLDFAPDRYDAFFDGTTLFVSPAYLKRDKAGNIGTLTPIGGLLTYLSRVKVVDASKSSAMAATKGDVNLTLDYVLDTAAKAYNAECRQRTQEAQTLLREVQANKARQREKTQRDAVNRIRNRLPIRR